VSFYLSHTCHTHTHVVQGSLSHTRTHCTANVTIVRDKLSEVDHLSEKHFLNLFSCCCHWKWPYGTTKLSSFQIVLVSAKTRDLKAIHTCTYTHVCIREHIALSSSYEIQHVNMQVISKWVIQSHHYGQHNNSLAQYLQIGLFVLYPQTYISHRHLHIL